MMKSKPRHLQTMSLREQYRSRGQGRRREETVPRQRSLWRLTVSAMLLSVVIGVKLTMPDVMEAYRDDVLQLLGEDIDFAEVFSEIGRAIGEGDVVRVFNDACVAVFGEETVEDQPASVTTEDDRNAVVYTAENTPYATMVQRILGFDTQNPVEGVLMSRFGYRDHPTMQQERFHYGLDIAAEMGAIISAFADGKVSAIGESAELGKYVEVLHSNGYSTLYAHCSKITASSEQTLRMGDPIAEVGQSGDATGPHLHFALYQDTLFLDPIYYVSY